MKCALCQVYSEQPELKRDLTDPNFAVCPRCGTRIPNYDGKIKFRGRPPKKFEAEVVTK